MTIYKADCISISYGLTKVFTTEAILKRILEAQKLKWNNVFLWETWIWEDEENKVKKSYYVYFTRDLAVYAMKEVQP